MDSQNQRLMHNYQDISDLLRHNVTLQPNRRAVSFLDENTASTTDYTYAELDQRARQIAKHLSQRTNPGDRVVIFAPTGIELTTAIFGCHYAQVVLTHLPIPRRNQPRELYTSIFADLTPRLVLTTEGATNRLQGVIHDPDSIVYLDKLTSCEPSESSAHGITHSYHNGGDELAYLQYTSGSTRNPRGVMVSHANVIANLADIHHCAQQDADSVCVLWLPLYHDMGLMTLLYCFYIGFPVVMFPHQQFIQQPIRWLEAVSHHKATTAGGPNFAYDLCLSRITGDEMARLDLSRWRLAFCGAEPIRAKTLDDFAMRFAKAGFRYDAFTPCYGLAENTVAISGRSPGTAVVRHHVSRQALKQHQIVIREDDDAQDSLTLVSSGRSLPSNQVLIVDPETRAVLDDRQIGEIWVTGKSKTLGYWNSTEETEKAFCNYTAAGDGPYLRTGDLGFLDEGELFVTGRLKDMIIVAGHNHYPEDIEQTVYAAHCDLVQNGAAAFCWENGREHLVVLQEVDRQALRAGNHEAMTTAIQQAVVEVHGIKPSAVVLLKPGQLPRTTSGKVQRSRAKQVFPVGKLNEVYRWHDSAFHIPHSNDNGHRSVANGADTPNQGKRSADEIQHWLIEQVARRLQIDPSEIDPREPFARHGLGSIDAMELSGRLEDFLHRSLPDTLVFDYPRFDLLARHLAQEADLRPAPTVRQPRVKTPTTDDEPIAIVGMGCRFPGANNIAEFWNLLRDGRDAVRQVPPDRWDADEVDARLQKYAPGATVRWGGFLNNIDGFDPAFFGISPREADYIDPQQRLLMEVIWEALEDAGQVSSQLAGQDVGVFIGLSTNDYGHRLHQNVEHLDPYWATGNAGSIAANRISYTFDFKGPSLTVDTACSSSLVAAELARRQLQQGNCSMAIVGGANLILSPAISIGFAKAAGLAPDGRCKAFAAGANGICRSEGVGAVIFKPLSKALADGDRIYAVLRGGAVNQDGRTNGITASSKISQEAVLRKAYEDAGIAPSEVQYMETHGPGTALGDVMETSALGAVFAQDRADDSPLWLGSVKTNIGHCEAAAGVAGLIKTALVLHNEQIPGNLHFDEPNPNINFESLRLRVPTEPTGWQASDKPRLAGINGFGFGGTNAHLILAEAPRTESCEQKPAERTSKEVLFPISAKSPKALHQLATTYVEKLSASEQQCLLADWASTVALRRDHLDYRKTFTAQSTKELVEQLETFAKQDPEKSSQRIRLQSHTRSGPVFVYSGHGGHWWRMGRQLCRELPLFRTKLEQIDHLLSKLSDWSLFKELDKNKDQSRITAGDLEVTQTSVFMLQMALTDVWQDWGITPAAVVGHSVGEVAAACTAGIFDIETGLQLVQRRGRLLNERLAETSDETGMASVRLPLEEAQASIGGFDDRVWVSAHNAPSVTVYSGELAALEELLGQFRKKRIAGKVMNVSGAGHSPFVDPVREKLEASLHDLRPQPECVPFYSTVTSYKCGGAELNSQYWGRNVREPVLFAGTISRMIDDGHTDFLEIGPHPILKTGLVQCLGSKKRRGTVVHSLRHECDNELRELLQNFGELYQAGHHIDWSKLYGPSSPMLELPNYPWQRQKCWLEESVQQTVATTTGLPILGEAIDMAWQQDITFWRNEISAANLPEYANHSLHGQIVLPVAAVLDTAFAAVRSKRPDVPFELHDVELLRMLLIPQDGSLQVQFVLKNENDHNASFEIYSRPAQSNKEIDWELCVRGRIQERQSLECSQDFDTLTAFREQSTSKIDGARFYQILARAGVNYSAALRTVQDIWLQQDEVVGRIETSSVPVNTPQLAPEILDGCMQLLASTAMTADADTLNGSYVPVAVGSVRVGEAVGSSQSVWCRARIHASPNVANEFLGDITAWDAEGRLVAQVEGLQLRCLDKQQSAKPVEKLVPRYFRISWQLQDDLVHQDEDTLDEKPGHWLIFADNTGIAQHLIQELHKDGHYTTEVHIGESESVPEDTFHLTTGADVEELTLLLQHVTKKDMPPVTNVVHMHSIDTDQIPSQTAFANADEESCLSVLRLTQGVLKHFQNNVPRLAIVTQGAQAVADGESVSYLQAPVWGLGRAIQSEHPELHCRLIDLPLSSDELTNEQTYRQSLLNLSQALQLSNGENQLALRGSHYYVARLIDHPMDQALEQESIGAHEDAAYFITGGLGGLGWATVQYMAAQGARNFVLMSRHAESEAARHQTEQLRQQGVNFLLINGDVTNREDVERALARTRQSLPPLRGVIHTAAAYGGALIRDMTDQQMREVLGPKVQGAWYLHELTQHDPLDFFVCFSSIASFLVTPRQANYSAANAALDALAHYRHARGLPALTIAWGPWSDVGFVTRIQTEVQLDAFGIQSIAPEEGVAAFGRLMQQTHSHVAVMKVDWGRVAQVLPEAKAISLLKQQLQGANTSSEQPSIDIEFVSLLRLASLADRTIMLENNLKERIAQALMLAEQDVDPHQSLLLMGVDSLTALELKNRLAHELGVELSLSQFMQTPTIAGTAAILAKDFEKVSLEEGENDVALGAWMEIVQAANLTPEEAEQWLAKLDSLSESELDALLNEWTQSQQSALS